MNTFGREFDRASPTGLESVVVPLASYICAAEQPKAALRTALEFLLAEVKITNNLANTHLATYLEGQFSSNT